MSRWLLCTYFLGFSLLAQPLAAQTAKPTFSEPLVQQALQGMLPSGTFITQLALTSDQVRLMGSAESNSQVSDYMRKIASSSDFSDIELVEISSSSAGVSYVMQMKIACSEAPKSSDRVLCGRTPPKAQAIYKCRINGSVSFQNKPCPKGSEL